MSVPRITQILEEEIQSRLESENEATREKAASDYLAFATLKELRKIRLMMEDATGTVIDDRDLDTAE